MYFLATTELNKNSVTVILLTVYWRSEFTDNLTEGWTDKAVCYNLHLNIIVQKISIQYHKRITLKCPNIKFWATRKAYKGKLKREDSQIKKRRWRSKLLNPLINTSGENGPHFQERQTILNSFTSSCRSISRKGSSLLFLLFHPANPSSLPQFFAS